MVEFDFDGSEEVERGIIFQLGFAGIDGRYCVCKKNEQFRDG